MDLQTQSEVAHEIYAFLLDRFGDEGLPMDTLIKALATVMASLASSGNVSDAEALESCAALFQTEPRLRRISL